VLQLQRTDTQEVRGVNGPIYSPNFLTTLSDDNQSESEKV